MISERINRGLVSARAAHRTAALARLTILATGSLSMAVAASRSWDLPDAVWYLAVPLLLASAAVPDSASPLLFAGTLAAGWLIGAPAEPSWSVVVVGCCLVVFHLAAAYAGQVPAYAVPGRGVLRRWLLPATVACLAAVVAAALSQAVQGRAGSLVLTIAALAGVGAVAWFVSSS